MRFAQWRYALPLWLRGLLQRRAVEHDLDEEIRDHLEQQIAANLAAGMNPEAAHRAALVAFGGVERIKDESRDARRLSLVDDVAQLRYAARSLRRTPVFTVATIATIALGVGAASTMFTLVNAVLLRPLPYPQSEQLVGVWNSFPGLDLPLIGQSPGTFDVFRRMSTSFESIGIFTEGAATVTSPDGNTAAERVPTSGVSGAIFPMLRVRPLLGRLLNEADDVDGAPRVAVIAEQYWRDRLGGATDVLDRHIELEGVGYQIVGVVPRTFAFPASNTRVWALTHLVPGQYLGSFGLHTIARLRPGVTIAAAERDLNRLLPRVPEIYAELRAGISTTSILEKGRARVLVHSLRDDALGGYERIVWLVAAIAAALVMVALSNVASLSLARVEARQRELAVRATLGASASRIWWSMSAEIAIACSVGGALGAGLATLAIELLGRLGPTRMPDPQLSNGGTFILPRLNEVHAGWALVLCAIAATIGFFLLSTVVASWRLRSGDLVRTLREGSRGSSAGRASSRLRTAFVVAEVALSLVLVSASLVLGKSLLKLFDVRPGFDAANLYTTYVPLGRAYRALDDVIRFYDGLTDRIGRIPGVVAVGLTSKPPLQGGQALRPTYVEDQRLAPTALPAPVPLAQVNSAYFRAMRIPLVAGRTFDDEAARRGATEVLVSRTFARQYWRDSTGAAALGRRVRPYAVGPWLTIVGVVGDVRDSSLTGPPQAMLYLPEVATGDIPPELRAWAFQAIVVRTRTAMPDIGAQVEREVHALDRNVATYQSAMMTETVRAAGSRMRLVLLLLAVGALVTLTLGAVGLYGVIAYAVAQRTRELGIRIALGLAPGKAVRMVMGQGELIVVIGAVIGLALFVVFARLLSSLVYEVRVVDFGSVMLAVVALGVVSTLATWLPARRAARIDPGEALRAE